MAHGHDQGLGLEAEAWELMIKRIARLQLIYMARLQ